ncbi:Phage terminase-like protein, large subunit, contains N-terminal HTH domain [Nocardia amikacinitolerans]|uniref:Phage terminase-like protein, large subunit, contains N-terminal HTH domain n=1 Tax=Nocardia amikacinitolerans TaxID=756689 RepID=A0A285LGS0_9NOCA|nr:terminase [Nocardia amikacinitolerans]SNY84135.1 Phage terminase-like protein, large subunit, contains N-terminal HTH domain [Nocardia amikacinitolerans]
MARRRRAATRDSGLDDAYAQIVDWYRHQLSITKPPNDLLWEPIKIGPTWQWDEETGWLLPKWTLGWGVLAWCGHWLRDKDGDPWQFTMEQARFILWFFAVDEEGDFLYPTAVLQRMKGHGKDPVAACLALAACFAPVTFDHWDASGEPVGREEPAAWVQIVAVSQEQTENTFDLFKTLVSAEAITRYRIQINGFDVYGLGGTRRIQAVTSNPLSIEGGRPTLVIRNETQNWQKQNRGFQMAAALDGNVAKSATAARSLDICNAYRTNEESVGRQMREAYDQSVANPDLAIADLGLLYDSLEAPPEAPLTVEDAPHVVRAIRGDSVWLDARPKSMIIKSILNPSNTASESRRKWFNQILAAEDDWMQYPECWANMAVPLEVSAADQVVMFFDGSKSDDATALIGCRISDGYVFTLGIWERPPRSLPDWKINRDVVDRRVRQAFEAYNVVGFWADLSNARDDETGERYWEPYCDRWAEDFARELSDLPAVNSGPSRHLVAWDMRNPSHTAVFVQEAERFISEIAEELFQHDGHPLLTKHVKNAKRNPGKFGISLSKEHRESARKIDAAVCAVGARLMRRMWLNRPKSKKRPPGKGRVVVMN